MILSLCGVVVFTTGRFVLSDALLFVLVFVQSHLVLRSLRFRKIELVYVFLVYLFVFFLFLLVSRIAARDCGNPWTFPLFFMLKSSYVFPSTCTVKAKYILNMKQLSATYIRASHSYNCLFSVD